MCIFAADGCCGSTMETLDLRRIIDLHFHRSVWQMCCGRGTVSYYAPFHFFHCYTPIVGSPHLSDFASWRKML